MFSLASLYALLQILAIDIALAGDNALAVGLAAAGLPASKRHKAVLAGIVAATVLRILFAIFAVRILHITGILVAGGLLLIWVAWKMYRELRHAQLKKHEASTGATNRIANVPETKKLSTAIWQITAADLSMSLDNVLAVAGVARDNMPILIVGLVISVLLMGAAATLVAKLTSRYPSIAYIGLAIVLFTALHMIWDGAKDLIATI